MFERNVHHGKMAHLLMVCVCWSLGCEPGTQTSESGAAAPDSEVVDASTLWRARITEVVGESVIKIKPRDADAFEPFEAGREIGPGDTIATGTHAQVTLEIMPGDGEIFLDHLSEATLLSAGPGLALHRGHALVTSPHHTSQAKKVGPSPQVILPTGKVTLTGTRISAHATPEEGRVAVSQGEVTAVGEGGKEITASFGQEIVLRDGEPAAVLHAPDLGQAFSWSEAADQRDETLPQLERGMGKLVARRPYSEVEQDLELRDHTINVRIQGMMAYTEITEEFYNPGGDNLEGLYRFPLPPDAQISRLSLLVGNRWMEGQFLENARAERIWRQIATEPRVQPRDPALLKWKQGNQFELRIFPIPPRGSRKIKIGYVQKLQPTGDGYRYTYPMPVDRSGQSHASRFAFNATVKGLDEQHPVTLENYTGHKITRQEQGLTALSFERENFRPTGDLSLRFMLPSVQHELRTYTYADKENPKDDAYVAVSIRPQFETAKTTDGRDFVIVIDRSYGRKGAAMAIQRALTSQLVHEMDPQDRVRVIACESRCTSIGPKRFEQASADLAGELMPALDALDAHGSTYAIEAMRSAARLFAHREQSEQARPAHLIYMTDGVVSAGPAHPSTLERAAQKVFEGVVAPELSVISFGGDEDVANLEAIATSLSGDVITLEPGSSMIASALDILRYHYTAPLEEIAVEWPLGVEHVYPANPGRLLPGEEITLVGRLKEDIDAAQLVLRGTQNGKPKELTYAVNFDRKVSKRGNAFVPRLWAKHRIDAIELTDGDVRDEVVKLSQTFGILTRYTSLLALESEEMMREFNVKHQRHIDWLGDAELEAVSTATATGGGKKGGVSPVGGHTGLMDNQDPSYKMLAPGDEKMFLGQTGSIAESSDLDNSGAEAGELLNRQGPRSTTTTTKAKRAKGKARGDSNTASTPQESFEPALKKPAPVSKTDSSIDDLLSARDSTKREQPSSDEESVLKEEKKSQSDVSDKLVAKTSSRPAKKSRSRRHRRYCSKTYYFKTEDAQVPSSYYTRRSERARQAHRDDPSNRTKYMDAIRRAMKLEANGQGYAERTITSWLEINDMDPEALVLRGQVALNKGDVTTAKRWLFSAPDAAARAPWLLERVKNASRISGDFHMACAYEQTIADTKTKRDANQDLLECGASTLASTLFDGVSDEPVKRTIRHDKNLGFGGRLRIEAKWNTDEQIHIVLVEPTGRLLSWMSTRQKLHVYNDEPGWQILSLPELRAGSYDIRLVREHPGNRDLSVDLTITLDGRTTKKQVMLSGLSEEVAQITRKSKRKCY